MGTVLILAGAGVMSLSLLRFRSVLGALPFVDASTRTGLRRMILAHGGLMAFFLAGYLITAVAFVLDWQVIGESSVGVIFAAGALFVYLGLAIQTRLVGELMVTMGRLVPMCAVCRKIRLPDADSNESASWQPVNLRFGGVNESIFSHTICPACVTERYGEGVPALRPAAEGNPS